MATKKFLDLNGLLYFWNKVKTYVDNAGNNKVDKEVGKGLSTNDYTNEEKAKLQGLNNYTLPKASADTLGGIKVGAGLSITGEGILSATGGGTADAVNWENVVGRPTNVSAFTNDAGYQTASDVESTVTGKGYQTAGQVETAITEKGYQTSTQVESAITSKGYQTSGDVDAKLADYAKKTDVSSVYKYKGSVENYEGLPVSDQQVGDTYNVKAADNSHGIKAGDNVVWDGSAWDVLSGTVDLSGYMQEADLVAINNGEIDGVISE